MDLICAFCEGVLIPVYKDRIYKCVVCGKLFDQDKLPVDIDQIEKMREEDPEAAEAAVNELVSSGPDDQLYLMERLYSTYGPLSAYLADNLTNREALNEIRNSQEYIRLKTVTSDIEWFDAMEKLFKIGDRLHVLMNRKESKDDEFQPPHGIKTSIDRFSLNYLLAIIIVVIAGLIMLWALQSLDNDPFLLGFVVFLMSAVPIAFLLYADHLVSKSNAIDNELRKAAQIPKEEEITALIKKAEGLLSVIEDRDNELQKELLS